MKTLLKVSFAALLGVAGSALYANKYACPQDLYDSAEEAPCANPEYVMRKGGMMRGEHERSYGMRGETERGYGREREFRRMGGVMRGPRGGVGVMRGASVRSSTY